MSRARNAASTLRFFLAVSALMLSTIAAEPEPGVAGEWTWAYVQIIGPA